MTKYFTWIAGWISKARLWVFGPLMSAVSGIGWKAALAGMLSLALLILVVFEVSQKRLIVMPMAIPPAVASAGYSPEVAADRLIDKIQGIYEKSRRFAVEQEGLDFVPLSQKIDFVVYDKSVTFQTIVDLVRIFTGFDQSKIYSDVVCISFDCSPKNGYILRARISGLFDQPDFVTPVFIKLPEQTATCGQASNDQASSDVARSTNPSDRVVSSQATDAAAVASKSSQDDGAGMLGQSNGVSCTEAATIPAEMIVEALNKSFSDLAEEILYHIDSLSYFASKIETTRTLKDDDPRKLAMINNLIKRIQDTLRPTSDHRPTLLFYDAELQIRRAKIVEREREARMSHGYRSLIRSLEVLESGQETWSATIAKLLRATPTSSDQLAGKILNRIALGYRRAEFKVGADSIYCSDLPPNGADIECAVRHYEKAIERDPSNPIIHNNFAFALRKTCDVNSLSRADFHYSRAVALRPDYARAYNNYAVLTRYLGQPRSVAERRYELSLESEPSYGLAHQNYAFFLMQDPAAVGRALFHIERAEELGRKSDRFKLRKAQVMALQSSDDYSEQTLAWLAKSIPSGESGLTDGNAAIHRSVIAMLDARGAGDAESMATLLAAPEWSGEQCGGEESSG